MRSLLIDTNILMLHVVGSWSPLLISKSKRTSVFTEEDFDLLQMVLKPYSSLLVTPPILTEVTNLLMPTEGHKVLAQTMVSVFEGFDERSADFRTVMADPAFWRLGFTDTMIAILAADQIDVLTNDVHLYAELLARGVNVTNFNHLRTDKLMG
jgi:hypothetical protein